MRLPAIVVDPLQNRLAGHHIVVDGPGVEVLFKLGLVQRRGCFRFGEGFEARVEPARLALGE